MTAPATEDPDNTNRDGTTAGAEEQSVERLNSAYSETDNTSIVLKCIFKNDVERFKQCFEDEEDPYKDVVEELLSKRDTEGKSPLDLSAILGQDSMLKELLTRGVEVNAALGKGYTSLHHAAAWGRVACLKSLVEGGSDVHLKTRHGETARDVAVRYKQTECVDFLDWADAKRQLSDYITSMQEIMADPEKIQGRLDRAEKNSTLALLKEKTEWLDSSTNATTQDFMNQRLQMEDSLQPIIQKINEPPAEKPEKK